MFCRVITATLLLSGFYTNAQLYAARRVIVQCAAVGKKTWARTRAARRWWIGRAPVRPDDGGSGELQARSS